MTPTLTITPTPESAQRLTNILEQLEDRLRIIPGVLTYIAEDDVVAKIVENFETESDDGTPWAELRPRTVQERRELGFPGEHPILYRTGQLFLSLTVNAVVEREDSGSGRASLAMGTDDARFRELQQGREDMEPRPMVPESRAGKTVLCMSIEEHCVDFIEGIAEDIAHA